MSNLLKNLFKNMGEKMGKLFDFGGRRGGVKKEGDKGGDPQKENSGAKVVEIVRFSRPESVVLARCTLRDGIVHLEKNEKEEGSKNIVDDLERNGVPDPKDPTKKLFPKDGETFLQALFLHYRTVYLGVREAREDN
ncbi:hypothetical protein KKD80_02735 [Patescibacteria group bacterium]|nr:hypothetical protein [Patescibacteria group bacterium]